MESFYAIKKRQEYLKAIDIFYLKYKQWWKLNKKIKFQRITYDVKETKNCGDIYFSHKHSAEAIIMNHVLKKMNIPFLK